MATGVTPGRKTVVEFNGSQVVQVRPPWALWRWANQLGLGVSRKTEDAQAVSPSLRPNSSWIDAWSLNPLEGEIVNILRPEYSDGVIIPSEVTTARNFSPFAAYRTPDLTGIGAIGGLLSGPSAFRKATPTGQAWDHPDNRLSDDEAAFAKLPGPKNPIIPADRVLVGNVSYKPNSGFWMMFSVAGSLWPADVLLNFYFGGPVDTDPGPSDDPATQNAGTFGLQLRASGWAHLYELCGPPADPASWKQRLNFRWSDAGRVAGGVHTLLILPAGRDRIAFTSRTNEAAVPSNIFNLTQQAYQSAYVSPIHTIYRATQIETGRTYLKSMTGWGPIRLDIGREIQHPLTLLRAKYPLTSTLLDGVFSIPYELPAATVLKLDYVTYSLGRSAEGEDDPAMGGTVTGWIYDADTNLPLAAGTNPREFLSVPRQTKYYVRTDFSSDDEQHATPLLFGLRVSTDGLADNIGSTPINGGTVTSFEGTGADLDPTHETYSVSIADLKKELDFVRTHDRVYTQIKVQTTDDPRGYVVIGEGETSPSDAQLRGKARRLGVGGGFSVYPNAQWRNWDRLRILGMWRRHIKSPNQESIDFHLDPTAPPDNKGVVPPWKVTDAISRLILNGGTPADEIDVPDNDLRFWPSPSLPLDAYLVQPGALLFPLAVELAIRILGQPLVRDFNVGPPGRGMWRLLDNPPPGPPFTDPNVLAEFFLMRPLALAGLAITQPLAFGGPASTFIRQRSFFEKHYAPEGNYLTVTTTGETILPAGTTSKLVKTIPNAKSFNMDPAHPTADVNDPDWLGFREAIDIYDPFLMTEEAVDYVATREYQFACHAEDWAFWESPYLFVNDPFDLLLNASGPYLRPMRINDLIRINKTGVPGAGRLAILRSCNPRWKRDRLQMAHYEAKYLEPDTP